MADLFQIEKRGYLREGYWADFVLVDLEKSTTVNKDKLLAKCGWSPFEGQTFGSCIDTTVVSGQVAWRKGRLNENVRGQPMKFCR